MIITLDDKEVSFSIGQYLVNKRIMPCNIDLKVVLHGVDPNSFHTTVEVADQPQESQTDANQTPASSAEAS